MTTHPRCAGEGGGGAMPRDKQATRRRRLVLTGVGRKILRDCSIQSKILFKTSRRKKDNTNKTPPKTNVYLSHTSCHLVATSACLKSIKCVKQSMLSTKLMIYS